MEITALILALISIGVSIATYALLLTKIEEVENTKVSCMCNSKPVAKDKFENFRDDNGLLSRRKK